MKLRRHAVSALVVLASLPALSVIGAGTAEAGNGLRFAVNRHEASNRVDVLPDGAVKYGQCWVFSGLSAVTTRSITARVESDAGKEDVPLIESDAWLHGAATIKALPETDAVLTLTLYDKASASLASFSGTLGADGTVTLAADSTKDTLSGCDTTTKSGCTSDTSSDTSTDTSGDTSRDTSLDIEVLAAEVFAAASGYEVGLDLAGADTYEVAYAEITVDETVTIESSEESCSYDRKGGLCVLSGLVRTRAEVGWDDIGSVWEGDLTLDPEGVIDVKVKSYDAEGEELDSTKVALGAPWLDGGEGANVLAVDEDPLSTVAMLKWPRAYDRCGWSKHCAARWQMVVNSEGWSAGDAMPVEAQVELTNGETITMSSPTAMRLRKRPEILYQAWENEVEDYLSDIGSSPLSKLTGSTISITGGDFVFQDDSLTTLSSSPVCVGGTCVMLLDDGAGSYDLSVSTYGTAASKLPDDLELTVTVSDASGEELASQTLLVEFDEAITLVFANEVSFSEDPIGLDLTGKVSLLGAADSKGKQKTLAKGGFYGSFSRDGDGDLGLTGADKDTVSARGDILIGGEPIGFELTKDEDGDGVLNPPPVCAVFGNGSGTKNATTTTSTRPELL